MLLLATVCLMAGCTKEGVYKPSEKISKIYYSSSYSYETYADGTWTTVYDESSDKELAQTWTWDGNKVASIAYDGWTANFTYDGKQLTRIDEGDGDIVLFTYDGSKLSQFEVYGEGTLWCTVTVTHDGKKVSQITVSYSDNIIFTDTKAARFGNEMMQMLLPIADQHTMQALAKGAKSSDVTTMSFTWDGDNISKQVISSEGMTQTATYTYDNKTNPYKGFVYALYDAGVLDWGNKNNVLTETYTYNQEGETGTYTYNYEYTYDGKWPLTKTEGSTDGSEEDGYRSSYSNTIYFEY